MQTVHWIAALLRRDALLATRRPLGLIARISSPIIAIAGFFFLSRLIDPHRSLDIEGRNNGYFAYIGVNLTFMLLQATALQAFAQAVRQDQLIGTLESIVASSPRPALLIAGYGAWPLLFASLQAALTLGIASTCMGLDLHATNVPSLSAFIVLSTLAMVSLGILAAAAVVAFKTVPPSNHLVGGAGALLAGTLFPTHLLPAPLQFISWCLPLTHALRGLRAAVGGEPFTALAPDAIWLAAATLVLGPVALFALDAAVEAGRRDGSLANY